MLSFPLGLVREPTEDDVLHIDPVVEYDRRKILRDWADKRMEQVGDGADDLIARGRPTGP
ncbi:MAG: hypothetical protein M3Z41_06525 [Candidatus Eremiobacteraeota bacterium]|nr:hypothetical protein [Candidatus Eremiobacteraeota bacterium]